MATNLLPVIITIIGVGVALAGFMLTVMLVGVRLLNQRIGESEARLTQRIDDLGTRTQRLEREVAEVKGALGIIRDALSLRVGE